MDTLHAQGGVVQPRDVQRALIKRLRALRLPDRFVRQLDEAEALVSHNQLRLLQATRVESADYGFALLAHELEILDGVLTLTLTLTLTLILTQEHCFSEIHRAFLSRLHPDEDGR